MDVEWIKRNLPEDPPNDLVRWVLKTAPEEITADMTVVSGERVRLDADMVELFDNRTQGKSVWAEFCRCNVCSEGYYAAKVPGQDGFYVVQGDDGTLYPLAPEENPEDDCMVVPVVHNDTICCPYCDAETVICSAKRLKGGRKKQIQVETLQRVGKYGVIVYWLVLNQIEESGCFMDVEPRYAYVVGDRGGIKAFSHRDPGVYGNDRKSRGWHQLSDSADRWDARYHDWGSINDSKAGTLVYPEVPDMTGTTVEKTGLMAYWEKSGYYPVDYIRLWRRWKSVENICTAGFGKIIEKVISLPYTDEALCDVVRPQKRKPHEIFQMSKPDFKKVKAMKSKPGYEDLRKWSRYIRAGGSCDAISFFKKMGPYGRGGMEAALEIMEKYHDADLPKLENYMSKQNLGMHELRLLIDCRDMAKEIHPRHIISPEEMWPRRLQEAHTRLVGIRVSQVDAKKAAEYQKGFDAVLEKYKDLQWTDGELAMILPKNNGDLIREGDILRHCVGGYGNSHSKGQRIIIFVRHYRRPERSYYTLNIAFDGAVPQEIQLHGYGNEHHGESKQYVHHIPAKVREFVDKWEKDVLLPWWAEQTKERSKTA